MASKPKTKKMKPELIPRLKTMGCFVILLALLAFGAGKLRNELVLTLLGTIFLVILLYCFLAVFISGLIYRLKIRHVSMTILNEVVSVGKEGTLSIMGQSSGKRVFRRFPAVIFRYELYLETKDGRVIICYIDPDHEKDCNFPVKERGAYYGEYDRFRIFDAPGFFSLCLPVYRSKSPRLLAVPFPVEDTITVPLKPGGSEERKEPHFRKSDEFIDHRPYVPGDDPRRINWKLYSHAPLGDLFVREGESEPPPHSRLLILIDTEVDQSLYSINEGRRAVDLLCESALALASEYISKGLDINIGWTGGNIIGSVKENGFPGNAEISAALAWPSALRTLNSSKKESRFRAAAGGHFPKADYQQELPKTAEDRAILIIALPRTLRSGQSTKVSALDKFLLSRETRHEADILFLLDSQNEKTGTRRAVELEDAARACLNLYNKKSGIHSNLAAVSHSSEGIVP